METGGRVDTWIRVEMFRGFPSRETEKSDSDDLRCEGSSKEVRFERVNTDCEGSN